MNKGKWVVYLVRCSDESLYCGITNNIENRLLMHNSSRGAKYTRSRRPVELVAVSSEITKNDALKMEYRIKRVSADKKVLELKNGKVKTMDLQKELRKVRDKINAVVKTIEKSIASVKKPERPQIKTSKEKSVKGADVKKSVTKQSDKITATDRVFEIIKKSKKGVNTTEIIKKTGFKSTNIYNIISRLKKQGRVKTVGKGMYVVA